LGIDSSTYTWDGKKDDPSKKLRDVKYGNEVTKT